MVGLETFDSTLQSDSAVLIHVDVTGLFEKTDLDGRGYYDLRIWDVMRLDTGNYSCSVYGPAAANSSKSNYGPLLLRSRTSRVTVYYLPPLSYPECPTEMQNRILGCKPSRDKYLAAGPC